MIKAIIFDFGGVIVTLDQSQAVHRFASLGLEDAEERLDPYTQQGIFGDLEIGRISAETFCEELSRLAGRKLTSEDCLYGWMGYCKEVPQRNLRTLRELREKGFRLVLLSNTNPYMMSWAESSAFDGEGHSVNDYFDAVYVSYRVGCMKPDERFFLHVLQHERLLANECLFVDDGPRNVAAANQLGMYTFCPKNGGDWTRDLCKIIENCQKG